jgi:hypothetical protein
MNPEAVVEPVDSAPTGGALLRLQQRGSVLPWVLVVLLAAGAGVGWWQWKARSADSTAAARAPGAAGPGGGRFGSAGRTQPVSVDKVRREDVHVNVTAIGTITASDTATVRAQVGGVLLSLGFAEGEQVRQGQLLAQIDPRGFQAAVGQADGVLARDKALLENARVDLQRYQDLLAKDAIAKQQVDTQAALVRQLEGTVKTDEATLQSARLQLSDAVAALAIGFGLARGAGVDIRDRHGSSRDDCLRSVLDNTGNGAAGCLPKRFPRHPKTHQKPHDQKPSTVFHSRRLPMQS